MGRLSIAVDDHLVEEVRRLSGARTKREAFEIALSEYVSRKRLEELAQLGGSGLVDMSPDELERWRAGAAVGEEK
jgi:Arc/MetJ family transcription regulator